MIYMTGDTHGHFNRFSAKHWAEGTNLCKDDYVIICGDFGGIFSVNATPEEKWWLTWFDERPWTTLFIDGNHENFARLENMPLEQWHGGQIHRVSSSVIHLMRGQIYNLQCEDGVKTLYAFGGAASHDRELRIEDVDWWQREIPSYNEEETGLANLESIGNSVDLIVTHDCPARFVYRINPTFEADGINRYLEHVYRTVSFKKWFFGHYHEDRDFPPDNVYELSSSIVSAF